ncbi:hypothetical protein GE061_013069 [Apolygus lucorum]|uniref:Uncharacterized protein n=1 Tax=Apolygus lucorum TaxID=248454 RepID=A0A8S9XVC5_APOLU|nr:hypothetical protein GE061_013069 [Apolygus lucorum]
MRCRLCMRKAMNPNHDLLRLYNALIPKAPAKLVDLKALLDYVLPPWNDYFLAILGDQRTGTAAASDVAKVQDDVEDDNMID